MEKSSGIRSQKKKIDIYGIIVRILLMIIMIVAIVLGVYNYLHYPEVASAPRAIPVYILFSGCLVAYLYVQVVSTMDRMTRIANVDAFSMFALVKICFKRLHKYNSVFMNVKNLKYINQVATSAGGDQLLIDYAQALKKYIGKSGKVARLGGDNFVALIKKEKTEAFISFLDNLKINISNASGEFVFDVETRCGFYNIKEGDGISEMLNNASIAFNFNRMRNDGNYTWYEQQMAEKTLQAKEVNYKFKEAIENREFKVYYQPKVNGITGEIVGAEALVRWEKDGNIIAPYRFVPELERAGLVRELDFYVFEEVCRSLADWEQKGYPSITVSSNFSKYHLNNPKFADKVLDILADYKVNKEEIEVEFTESVGMEDYGSLKNFLRTMNERGIKAAIDDFGVGYSSLELIKDFNFDVIKIDKKFIDNVELNGGDNNEAVLLRNIIKLCMDFKKKIVAEGVENIGQKKVLLDMGCTIIQGYLYDKPMPREEFEKKLSNKAYNI